MLKIIIFCFMLSGCQKPVSHDDFPETKYPETPTMGAWEPLEN